MPISFTDRQGFSKIPPDAGEGVAGMLMRVMARVRLAFFPAPSADEPASTGSANPRAGRQQRPAQHHDRQRRVVGEHGELGAEDAAQKSPSAGKTGKSWPKCHVECNFAGTG